MKPDDTARRRSQSTGPVASGTAGEPREADRETIGLLPIADENAAAVLTLLRGAKP